MTDATYPPERTALLLIDPYNDFLSEGGKVWPLVKEVAEAVGLIDNLRAIVAAARSARIQIFYVPHRRWQPGDYADWQRANPYQLNAARIQIFAKGSWGGEWHADFAPRPEDVIVKEHWGSSGFANTDLDALLKQHDIARVIVIGLIANTCVECTSRFATELGYHVTLVKDATAAASTDAMRAAHELNGPTFAHSIVTTNEILSALSTKNVSPKA